MSLTYKRELITPQRARQLLASNAENNRNPKTAKIPQYARDMMEGHWDSNTGETIKVDTEGVLIDGQNRMHAVVMAGTAVYFDVVYDVPRAAMRVLDSGATRTAADKMKIFGAHDRFRAAAIIRWAIMWDAKVFLGRGGRFNPTHSEILARFESEPAAFDQATRRATDCQSRGLGTGAPIGVAHYLFDRIDPERTHQFFDQYISGANLPERSPVLVLRNRMGRRRDDRTTAPEQLALFIRAWNFFRKDEPTSQLIIVGSGKLTNDNFPMPK